MTVIDKIKFIHCVLFAIQSPLVVISRFMLQTLQLCKATFWLIIGSRRFRCETLTQRPCRSLFEPMEKSVIFYPEKKFEETTVCDWGHEVNVKVKDEVIPLTLSTKKYRLSVMT